MDEVGTIRLKKEGDTEIGLKVEAQVTDEKNLRPELRLIANVFKFLIQHFKGVLLRVVYVVLVVVCILTLIRQDRRMQELNSMFAIVGEPVTGSIVQVNKDKGLAMLDTGEVIRLATALQAGSSSNLAYIRDFIERHGRYPVHFVRLRSGELMSVNGKEFKPNIKGLYDKSMVQEGAVLLGSLDDFGKTPITVSVIKEYRRIDQTSGPLVMFTMVLICGGFLWLTSDLLTSRRSRDERAADSSDDTGSDSDETKSGADTTSE